MFPAYDIIAYKGTGTASLAISGTIVYDRFSYPRSGCCAGSGEE